MHYEYETKGTCSRTIFFDVENGILHNVQFVGGCNGNLKGIGALVEGMKAANWAPDRLFNPAISSLPCSLFTYSSSVSPVMLAASRAFHMGPWNPQSARTWVCLVL